MNYNKNLKLDNNITVDEIKNNIFICLNYRYKDTELLEELINKVITNKTYDYKTYFTHTHILYKNEIIDRYKKIKKIDKSLRNRKIG